MTSIAIIGGKVVELQAYAPGTLCRVLLDHTYSYYTSGSPEDLAGARVPPMKVGTLLMFLRHPTDDELVPGLVDRSLWGLFLWEENKVMVALYRLEPVLLPEELEETVMK